jgi:hypothetical protein
MVQCQRTLTITSLNAYYSCRNCSSSQVKIYAVINFTHIVIIPLLGKSTFSDPELSLACEQSPIPHQKVMYAAGTYSLSVCVAWSPVAGSAEPASREFFFPANWGCLYLIDPQEPLRTLCRHPLDGIVNLVISECCTQRCLYFMRKRLDDEGMAGAATPVTIIVPAANLGWALWFVCPEYHALRLGYVYKGAAG